MSTLDSVIRKTIHSGKITVEEMADLLGCSHNLLYKIAADENVDLQVKRLIPLMSATKDYRILHYIANRLGFAAIKIPGAKAGKPENINELQRNLNVAATSIIDFFDGKIEAEDALESINRGIRDLAGYRKTVEKGRQMDLFE